MQIKFVVLITSFFLYFTLFQFPISASTNYTEGLVIKSKPSTTKTKRLRLTDTLADKAWKGVSGKNVLKIDLGEERKFNTVRFRVKEDTTFAEVKIKAGTSTDNKVQIYLGNNKSALANDWIALKMPKTVARYVNLTLKNSRPKIFELEVYCTQKDFNGDGYEDVIVGASNHDSSGVDRGEIYIYLGGQTLSATPDFTLSGDEDFAYFGNSVSSAGDVNNDGFDDIIVGANLHDADIINSDRGRAYIYLGGQILNTTPNFTLSGDEDFAYFGNSVSSAGDVNNDGFDDVIIGASGHNAGGANKGRAYVYLGGTTINSLPIEFSGDEDFASFGNAVSGAGDINNDGFDDVIIGASDHNAGGTDRGQAYIYLGGTTLNSSPAFTRSGDENSALFGYSVSGAGDVNKDGFDDVIVGAYLHNAGGTDRGQAYIYLGGSSLSLLPNLVLNGDENFASFGVSVSGAGDVNKDGFDDVIVGASNHTAGGISRGRAYIYLGESTLITGTPAVTFNGNLNSANLGNAVSGAGDINKDGFDDVIVGAYLHDGSGTGRGQAYVYLGGSSFISNTASATFSGDENNALLGISVN